MNPAHFKLDPSKIKPLSEEDRKKIYDNLQKALEASKKLKEQGIELVC